MKTNTLNTQKLFLLTITLIAFFVVACEKEVEFKHEQISPKMVVNSFFCADSLISVEVATSRPIPGRNNTYSWPSDAIVKLFVDGTEVETLVFDSSTIEYQMPWNNEKFEQVKYYYFSRNTKGEIGRKYKIEVEHPVYGKTSGESVIPNVVAITGVDTTTFRYNTSDGEYASKGMLLTFTDPVESKNYYRVAMKVLRGQVRKNKDGDSIVYLSGPSYISYFISDDRLLNPDEGAGDILFGSPSNRYNLFVDDLINGKEYSIKIDHNNYVNTADTIKGAFLHTTFELYALSPEAYLYLKSVTAHTYYEDGLLSEPVQVYTNLNNKLGIFAGYSVSSKTFKIGSYPMEGLKYERDQYSAYVY